MIVELGNRRVVVTNHAVDRYVERIRPTLDSDTAAIELQRVLAGARFERTWPEWAAGSEATVEAHEWLMLTDDIAFPLNQHGVAATCLVRGELPGVERAAKANTRAKRSQTRQAIRQTGAGYKASDRKGPKPKRGYERRNA